MATAQFKCNAAMHNRQQSHMWICSLIAFAYSTYLVPNILWMCILSIYIGPTYSDDRINKHMYLCISNYINTRDINRFWRFDVGRYIYSLDKLPVMHSEWRFFIVFVLVVISLRAELYEIIWIASDYKYDFWWNQQNWEIVYMPSYNTRFGTTTCEVIEFFFLNMAWGI